MEGGDWLEDRWTSEKGMWEGGINEQWNFSALRILWEFSQIRSYQV